MGSIVSRIIAMIVVAIGADSVFNRGRIVSRTPFGPFLPTVIFSNMDREIMALTLYGEARGETIEGLRSVGFVILNRYKNPKWWSRDKYDNIPDDTIAAVCLDPWQFSCWNKNDPNRKILDGIASNIQGNLRSNTRFKRCYDVAKSLLDNPHQTDITSGSTHYHTTAVAPNWSKNVAATTQIGTHKFYNNIS